MTQATAPPLAGVYFAQAGDAIKIGFSGDVRGRVRTLSTASPVAIELLAVMPGDIGDERQLHRRFVRLCINGEWFRAEAELLDFIATLPPIPPEPERRPKPRYSPPNDEVAARIQHVVDLHRRRQQIEEEYRAALAAVTDPAGDAVPVAHMAVQLNMERKTIYRHLGRTMS